jgi:hypothetical protein
MCCITAFLYSVDLFTKTVSAALHFYWVRHLGPALCCKKIKGFKIVALINKRNTHQLHNYINFVTFIKLYELLATCVWLGQTISISVLIQHFFFDNGVYTFTFMWPCIVTNFFLIKPTRRTNFPNFILSKISYMFRAFPLPIIRSFLLYIRHCYSSFSFDDRFQEGSGWMLGSDHQTCMKLSSVECAVETSWWWAKEMPETCRDFWQNKIWEIHASCWFYLKKYTFS